MILILTSFSGVPTYIFVITVVTFVWSGFAFAFAKDKESTINILKNREIGWKEKIILFFKSDFSISVFLFIIFLAFVFINYIF